MARCQIAFLCTAASRERGDCMRPHSALNQCTATVVPVAGLPDILHVGAGTQAVSHGCNHGGI